MHLRINVSLAHFPPSDLKGYRLLWRFVHSVNIRLFFTCTCLKMINSSCVSIKIKCKIADARSRLYREQNKKQHRHTRPTIIDKSHMRIFSVFIVNIIIKPKTSILMYYLIIIIFRDNDFSLVSLFQTRSSFSHKPQSMTGFSLNSTLKFFGVFFSSFGKINSFDRNSNSFQRNLMKSKEKRKFK